MATPAEKTAQGASTAALSTLSQLIARILSQLSLSAWLPSAALVLLTAFVFQLGTVLDNYHADVLEAAKTPTGPKPDALTSLNAVTEAFELLGGIGAGAIALMIAAIIVLTMLTQAFAFESIRLLEGYWNSTRPVESIAQAFCFYFRWRRQLVVNAKRRLTRKAWKAAKRSIEEEQTADPRPIPHMSRKMIRALEVRVTGEGEVPRLKAEKSEVVRDYDWRAYAPVDHLRRLTNLDNRLRDYPSAANMRPTRLGNVLRHYEERTGYPEVESIVDEVFDDLPFSLQLQHDEQRGKIDLYCSMSFVCVFVALVAYWRFDWTNDRSYILGAALLGLIGAWVCYRAAIASASYYGALLLIIAEHKRKLDAQAATVQGNVEPATPSVRTIWWQRALRLATRP